jgi:hypothetical protein
VGRLSIFGAAPGRGSQPHQPAPIGLPPRQRKSHSFRSNSCTPTRNISRHSFADCGYREPIELFDPPASAVSVSYFPLIPPTNTDQHSISSTRSLAGFAQGVCNQRNDDSMSRWRRDKSFDVRISFVEPTFQRRVAYSRRTMSGAGHPGKCADSLGTNVSPFSKWPKMVPFYTYHISGWCGIALAGRHAGAADSVWGRQRSLLDCHGLVTATRVSGTTEHGVKRVKSALCKNLQR